jgi:hypothetical protein
MDDEKAAAGDEPLTFDRAEFAATGDAAPACSLCRRDLGESYFTINGAVACDDCHHLVSTQVKESKQARAFFRAAGLGAAAALGGSIAWYAVAKITGMEIGLLAIAVGYVVGKAVRHGARGPGGRRYQVLAILLTYLSITGSYAPLVLKTLTEGRPAATATATAAGAPSAGLAKEPPPAGASSAASTSTSPAEAEAAPPPAAMGLVRGIILLIAVICLSLVAPFLAGASNIIGILLIGIALYEAWKFNRPVPLVMDGPLHTSTLRRPEAAPSPEV